MSVSSTNFASRLPAMAIPPLRSLARGLQIRLCIRLRDRKFSSSSSSFGIQFLVEQCGIPVKTNSTRTQKIQFDEKASSDVKSVITFFKSHGFSEAEIAKLIEKDPLILRRRVSTNLDPKFQYLIDIGVEGSVLRQIVLKNPNIFGKSLNATIKPSYEFLKTVLGSDVNVRAIIKRDPEMLTTTKLERRMKVNIEYLTKQGVPTSRVMMFIRLRPIAMTRSNDRMVNTVEKVKDLGVMPDDPMFVYVLRVIAVISECTWKRKVEMLKSLGWSDEDVVSTLARRPYCFLISEKKFKMALDFFVNQMGIPREVIIAQPGVISYSLKETIRPRCTVVKVLEAEKLLSKWSLNTLLPCTEEVFIRNFITKHLDRVPHLLETYKRTKI